MYTGSHKGFLTFVLLCLVPIISYSQILKTIKQVKTLDNVSVLDTVRLQGYIICDPVPLLISDINLYISNSIIQEKDYILIGGGISQLYN